MLGWGAGAGNGLHGLGKVLAPSSRFPWNREFGGRREDRKGSCQPRRLWCQASRVGAGDGLSAAKMGALRWGWESLSAGTGAAALETEPEAEATCRQASRERVRRGREGGLGQTGGRGTGMSATQYGPEVGTGLPPRRVPGLGHRQDLLAGGRVAQTTDVKEPLPRASAWGRRRDRCMGASRYTPSPPGIPPCPPAISSRTCLSSGTPLLSPFLLRISSPQILPTSSRSHQPPSSRTSSQTSSKSPTTVDLRNPHLQTSTSIFPHPISALD